MLHLIIGGIVVLIVIVLLCMGYFKAPPDHMFIVSGMGKKFRTYVGKAGLKIPFFERLDKIYLGSTQVDVKTSQPIPTLDFINVKIDATASVKIGRSAELVDRAVENFLNAKPETIRAKVNELLEGNLREIIGAVSLKDMVNDRKTFSEKVQANAVPDLAKFGLELISFNVQNFVDGNGVIENLGIDNVAQIQKQAAIAKSNAKREISIAEAQNAKEANDAEVKAAEEIAARKNDLAIKQAQLKKISDTEKAQADAAMEIESQKQKELHDVAAMNAAIARAEREAELKEKEIQLKEKELDALVRKQADAEKYAAEQKAAAALVCRQKEAEAKAYEIKQQAEALKAKADADKYAALQQAEGITAVGKAEADAIREKAEAQKLMTDASVIEMVLKVLPEMTACAAAPLEKVDKIVMYGDCEADKIVKGVTNTTNQVIEGLAENGIDLKGLIAGFLGGKAANN